MPIAKNWVGMRKILSLTIVVGLLFLSFDIYAESKPAEERVVLNNEGMNILDQVSQLRQEAAALQANLDVLRIGMEKAENILKKVSTASVTARRQTKFLKKTKPEYEALLEQLIQKKIELKNREGSLALIEYKIDALEKTDVSVLLFPTIDPTL